MKRSNVLLPVLAATCLISFASAENQKKYTTKFDNIDIEAVLRNQKLLTNYIGCLLDKNPCTADGTELKRNLPEGLETNCVSCSERQKYVIDRFIRYLIDNRPNDWKNLEDRYDSSGAYRKRYQTDEAAKKEGNRDAADSESNSSSSSSDDHTGKKYGDKQR